MLMRAKRVINLNFDPFNIINQVRFWSIDIFKKKKNIGKMKFIKIVSIINQNQCYNLNTF